MQVRMSLNIAKHTGTPYIARFGRFIAGTMPRHGYAQLGDDDMKLPETDYLG